MKMPFRTLLRTLSAYAAICGLAFILSAVALEGTLRLGSKVAAAVYDRNDRGGDGFVVLTLGESTTAGDSADTWPRQLEAMLRNKYPGRNVRVINKGVPGTNTSKLVGNLARQIDAYRPDVIVSMMGINDERESAFHDTLFIPYASDDTWYTVRLARLARGYVSVGLRRIRDLYLAADAGRLTSIAEDFRVHGEYGDAELYLTRAIELTSDPGAYVHLALLFRDMERNNEAEQALLAAKGIAPSADGVYYELGNFYRDNGKVDRGEEMYQKALELNPENGLVYGEYGILKSWYRGDDQAAEPLYEKAIALSPEIVTVYFELADIYRTRGEWDRALSLYDRALAVDPGNTLALRERSVTLARSGGSEVAGAATDQSSQPDTKALHPATLSNYRKLAALAKGRRIPVIAMGYPLQPTGVLENALRGEGAVTVIGNDTNFHEALQTHTYGDLFTDYFGGNFGHATKAGNALIAENVFRAIESLSN